MSNLIINLSQTMRAEVDSLNAIAQNSANINTAGYKSVRSSVVDTQFVNALQRTDSANNVTTRVNTSRGQINATDRALDFAIIGDGWFGVLHNEKLALTRNGSFKLNDDNVLTTLAGDPVLGVDGLITLSSNDVSLDPNGTLLTAAGEKIQLAIYNDGDKGVSPIGDGLYSGSHAILTADNAKIIQGAIEQSNVDSAADMVRMMETTRHIESMQRALNTYNELLNSGINQIGK